MILINDTTLSMLPGKFAEYEYLFFNQTFSGRITGGVKKDNIPAPDDWIGSPPIFKLSSNNSIVFQPSEVDTLYRIDETKMIPVYALQPKEPIKNGDKSTGTFVIYLYSDKNRILFSKTRYESITGPNGSKSIISITPNLEYICFDLTTLQTRRIAPSLSLDNIDLNFGNGDVFFPNKNQIVLSYQAFEFKKMIDETIKSKNLTESTKERLEKLNSEIAENDNPVVIAGKLKER